MSSYDVGPDWANAEMAGAQVTHGKERISLGRILWRLSSSPGLRFSCAVGNAGRQAAHRIFAKQRIGVSGLLAGHVQATDARIKTDCPEGEMVLIASDTTSFHFGSHRKAQGLGPVSDGGLGVISHSALALTEAGSPLGLLFVKIWARDPDEVGKSEKRRQLAYSQKESFKWTDALRAVEQSVSSDRAVLLIQDREADIFPFVAQPRRNNVHLLIRASMPRNVQIGDGSPKPINLFQAIAKADPVGSYQIEIARRRNQPPRTAVLSLRCRPMTLVAPQHGHAEDPKMPQEVWVVQATEVADPQIDASPIEWTLISTLPVRTAEQAKAMVIRYSRRWLIERLHYTLKSGCGAEQLQIDDAHSLANALALYYIVAWRLLHLTYLGRTAPTTSAQTELTATEILVLSHSSQVPVTTISGAVLAIAKLAGYTSYRNASPPGVKSLWIGMRKLQDMAEGFDLAMKAMSSMNHA